MFHRLCDLGEKTPISTIYVYDTTVKLRNSFNRVNPQTSR